MPATLSILTNVFTDPAERAKAIAIWSGAGGMGVALGPLVGGWLLEHYWWGSVFLVNIPIIAAALIAGRHLVPTSKDPEAPPIDRLGALGVAVIGSLASAHYATTMRDFFAGPGAAAPTTSPEPAPNSSAQRSAFPSGSATPASLWPTPARTAFMDGWTASLLIATVVALIASAATLASYPQRVRHRTAVLDDRADRPVGRLADTVDWPQGDTAEALGSVGNEDRTPSAA